MKKEVAKNKTDFVALAVHKLKTPISSIKLSLEMLLGGDFGELSLEQRKVIERTYQRNDDLICLVNDLLNLAKVKNESTHVLKLVNFEKLIQDVIEYEQEKIKRRAIKVIIEKPTTAFPKIRLDKEKIFLAVQNIFSNAVKYNKIGGEVIISFNMNGKNLELKIQDQGIGVLPSEKEKLFTEFFRGENAKELDSMGSGLGLYITKNIIEGHHGKIWFESKENKGTTFFISIPIK